MEKSYKYVYRSVKLSKNSNIFTWLQSIVKVMMFILKLLIHVHSVQTVQHEQGWEVF